MSLHEKALAETIVDLEQQQSLGHDYTPIGDVLDLLHADLVELQRLRAVIHGLADQLAAAT